MHWLRLQNKILTLQQLRQQERESIPSQDSYDYEDSAYIDLVTWKRSLNRHVKGN